MDDLYRVVREAAAQPAVYRQMLPKEIQGIPSRLWNEKREWFHVQLDLKGQKFGSIGQRHEKGRRSVWRQPGMWVYTRCFCTACGRRIPPVSIGQLLMYRQANHGCMRIGCPALYGGNLQDDGTNRRAVSLQLTLWKIAMPEVVPLVYGGSHGDPLAMVYLDTPDEMAIKFCQSMGIDHVAPNQWPFLTLKLHCDVMLPGSVEWTRLPSQRLMRALANPLLALPGVGVNLMELEYSRPGAFKGYLRDIAKRKPELNYLTEEEYLMAFPVIEKKEAERVEKSSPTTRNREFIKEVIDGLKAIEVGEAILVGRLPEKLSLSNFQAALRRQGLIPNEHWRATKKIYDEDDNLITPAWDRPYVVRKIKEFPVEGT